MLRVFDNPEYLSEKEIMQRYPNSKFILKDVIDVNNVAGQLLAVSTDRESFKTLCIKRDEFLDKGYDVALLGSYGGMHTGILNKCMFGGINMELVIALKCALLSELQNRYRGGIYGYTQRALAFNSNKIEGSTLTEEQTAALFEEGYLPASEDVYRSKDVEEMTGHFLMFNKMLETLDQELTENLIKSFHYELKAGVFEDRANGYAIGDYKKRPNTVGGICTALPEEVSDEMQVLLVWYNQCKSWDLKMLAMFHSKYETIHPFQDGNGRTGRLILFRECLRHNCIPFIIHDSNRARYIEALKQAHSTQDYFPLARLFEEEQKDYEEQLKYFDVEGVYEDYLHANPTSKIL